MPRRTESFGDQSALGAGPLVSKMHSFVMMKDEIENRGSEQTSKAEPRRIGARLLLAEDDAINQMWLRRILQRFGCRVDCADDGNECLSMLERCSYDLVFTDIQMPQMDGIEATRIVRSRNVLSRSGGPIPIIALTGNVALGMRERCIDAGMNDYLTKPIEMDRLRTTLERCLLESDLATRIAGADDSEPAV